MPEGHARRNPNEHYGASSLELFFDLVFVFAITQVSHLLLEHLNWRGALEAAMVLLVVWWAWQYTTWATNELDPDRMAVRFALLIIMMASLLMAVGIPEAFGDKGLLFAIAYVFIQVGRQSFLTFSAAPDTIARARGLHILHWFCFAAPFWIIGALFDGDTRILIWLIALVVDYSGPFVTYYVPWLKKIGTAAWQIGSGHFAERFQLFTIIALGETIVLTGATTSGLDFDLTTALAFTAAFASTACLWWLYFNHMATILERVLDEAEDRTAIGRDIFTYGHIGIIAGIILCAVGDEIVLGHPSEYLHTPELVAVVGGPTIYLLAFTPTRWRLTQGLPWRRIYGAIACFAIGVFAYFAHPAALVTGALLVLALVGVIAHEYFFRWHRRDEQDPEEDPAAMVEPVAAE
jgi:low temperature requirement protein LtrA